MTQENIKKHVMQPRSGDLSHKNTGIEVFQTEAKPTGKKLLRQSLDRAKRFSPETLIGNAVGVATSSEQQQPNCYFIHTSSCSLCVCTSAHPAKVCVLRAHSGVRLTHSCVDHMHRNCKHGRHSLLSEPASCSFVGV